MARSTSSSDLKDVLARLEPAVAAVDRAESAVAAALEGQKLALRSANEQRSAVIMAAKATLDKAEAAYARAEAAAVADYKAIVDGVEAKVRAARLRHAEACTEAQPLLEQVEAMTERVKGSAGRRR